MNIEPTLLHASVGLRDRGGWTFNIQYSFNFGEDGRGIADVARISERGDRQFPIRNQLGVAAGDVQY